MPRAHCSAAARPRNSVRHQKAHDAVIAMRRLVDAANSGELSPMDATELAKLVEAFTKAVAVHEHEERITALEKKDKR